MATTAQTTKTPAASVATKPEGKQAPRASTRATEIVKRAALKAGALTESELDELAVLCGALKVFLKS